MGAINQIKTVVLLGLLTSLLLWIGSFWGRSGLIIGLVFALIMNFGSYWFSDKIVLKMYKAKEVSESREPRLWGIVKEVSHLAGLPMPKVYVVPSGAMNAFATGRNYDHSAIACTEGILKELNESELKGVIAHEMSHIKNRDILISTIAATIAGVISYIAMMARWGAMFGGFGRDRDGGNMIQLLVLAILTPIIAMILQLAISRSREFLADASAAKILHNPHGLISALEKLSAGVKRHPLRLGNQATSSLFIVNPFKAKGLMGLFSTHPRMEERISKLKEMG